MTKATPIFIVIFTLVMQFACKKEQSHPTKTSYISSINNSRSSYEPENYLYSTIAGNYNYEGNILKSIDIKKTGISYKFTFSYGSDGRILNYKGSTLPAEWGGGYSKVFYYDNFGRVDTIITEEVYTKDDCLMKMIIKYDSKNKIVEYTELFNPGVWSRKFYYQWNDKNISMLKVMRLKYEGFDTTVCEAIVKYQYDHESNPFLQENKYLFRHRYLNKNNPISDSTFKYKYTVDYYTNKVTFIGIDTIINSYTNQYDVEGRLVEIVKNGVTTDEISYIDILD